MLSLLKQVILYFYIVLTKSRQRNACIEQLKHKCRPQRDIAFDKPGLPDSVDDTDGVPAGWNEMHSISAFDRDGICMQFYVSNRKDLYVHIPTIGTLTYSETDGDEVVEEGCRPTTLKKRLKCDVVDPMQTWSIAFRGHMKREPTGDEKESTCFVRFRMYWKSTGDPFDFWLDTPPWQLAGKCLNLGLTDAMLLLSSKSVWYEQWGELRGSLKVDDAESRIRMPSCRERKYICDQGFENRIGFAESQNIEIDGIAHRFSYKTVQFGNGKRLQLGHVIFPSLESYTLTEVKQNTERGQNDRFKVNFCSREVDVSKTLSKRIVLNDRHTMTYNTYTMDANHATGVFLKTDMNGFVRTLISTKPNMKTENMIDTDENVFLIDITDARCRNTNLVGGKAANLSSLLGLGYSVPPAFCVTTKAFEKILKDNQDLANDVNGIINAIKENRLQDLEDACVQAVECLTKCHVSPQISIAIDKKIREMKSLQLTGVAVRSSAVGEDGEMLSAAGQMESILGVRSLDTALEALKQCWSSYFSFQSVEYRRQNGQLVMNGMGVVFQEMVPSEVSGVLMTHDPLSGREDRLLINACFGLGEAVVSGKVESDTFIIGIEENGEFSILKENVGSKSQRIELVPSGGTCTRECLVNTDPCLSKELIYRLCAVGKSIERNFKLEQEIEWAIYNDQLYILQTRPITTIDEETDEDLFHEFDTPVIGNRELYTTCNIQEMMPGATTPLTASYFINVVSDAFSYIFTHLRDGADRIYYPHGFVASCGNKYFLNISPLYVTAINGFGGVKAKTSFEIDLLGEERKDVTIDDIMNYKGTRTNTTWQMLKCFVNRTLNADPKLDREFLHWEGKMYTYTIGEKSNDAISMFKHIDEDRTNLLDTMRVYFHVLVNPDAIIVKRLLMGSSSTFTREHQEDLSNLLIKCGTESADVPKAITKLAYAIKTSEIFEVFLSLSDEDSLTVLKDNDDLNELFEEFIDRHGHRGIREAEFIEKSWSQNPVKLVSALKSIIRNGITERKDDDTDECKIADILSNIKSKVSPFNRWLMKVYFLKEVLKKVVYRERGKSLVIKVIEAFKIAYWSLARMMVTEGRLPDEKLLFFLTHREIGKLIDSRCPTLIRKAKRRMKIFPLQQDTMYEQFSFGSPKCINARDDIAPLSPSEVIEGMPVGHGEAIGRACIVTRESDVGEIRKGDILICQYTDVGWSPYFPLIRGLVTEIGSILSHGAVIARECGIPCIVNVKNATSLLKSGDFVRINGNKGTVEKLPAAL